MRIRNAETVEAKQVEMDQAEGVTMRMLIGPADDAPTFNMRLFEVAPGGYTPRHTHDWEHEVYVLSGVGIVLDDEEDRPILTGDFVYIPPNEDHQFHNTGGKNLKFLCLVPKT